MDKMVMVIYNEAMDEEVMEVLTNCGLKSYTKLNSVFGSGETSGIHMGDDIFPGRNNILYIGCDKKQAAQLLGCVKELRRKLGHEGIKGFVMPIEGFV
jgi:hypothetical protein